MNVKFPLTGVVLCERFSQVKHKKYSDFYHFYATYWMAVAL